MSMSFNTIPSAIRTAFVGVEVDNSRALGSVGDLPYRILFLTQKTTAGTQGANTVSKVTSHDEIGAKAGKNSMAFGPGKVLFENNTFAEISLGVVDDASAGVAATGSLAFAGTATKAGTIPLRVGNRFIGVSVPVGMTAAQAAAAAKVEIDLVASSLPITSGTVSGASLPLTFNHKGLYGNDYPLTIAAEDGEAMPDGLTCTVTAFAGGTTNPTLTSMIAALGNDWYQVIIHPWTDATSLSAIEAELADRFKGTRMIDGMAVTSAYGSYGTLTSLGATRNSPHSSIAAQNGPTKITTPSLEWAAAVGAKLALECAIDPARPLQTVELNGVRPAKSSFSKFPELNLMLYSGISTTEAGPGGVAQIDRLITTYRTNATGSSDPSYLDVTTMMTLMFLRWSFRTWIRTRCPRHKLSFKSGSRVASGQPIMTPALMTSEALAWFDSMERRGFVENKPLFAQNLSISEHEGDVNRMNVLLPPDIINQLIVVAGKIQFAL